MKIQYCTFQIQDSFLVLMYSQFDLSVYKMPYVMLATLKQFNFCYLLRVINISSVHGVFSLSINVQM